VSGDATHALAGTPTTTPSCEPVRPVFRHLLRRRTGPAPQWRQWVEATLQRADGAGELAEAVVARDAVIAVVAATVGFEVLERRTPNGSPAAHSPGSGGCLLPRLARRPPSAICGAGSTARAAQDARGTPRRRRHP